MSHSAVYIIDIKGVDFNYLLPPEELLDDAQLLSYYENDLLLEFSLYKTSPVISGEVTGDVTILWAPWRFSVLLSENKLDIKKIKKWEIELKKIIGIREIWRIDESLLMEWELKNGEYWFRKKSAFMDIKPWMMEQDIRHCALLFEQ